MVNSGHRVSFTTQDNSSLIFHFGIFVFYFDFLLFFLHCTMSYLLSRELCDVKFCYYYKSYYLHFFLFQLRFYYHMYGKTIGSLNVYTRTSLLGGLKQILSLSGNYGDAWMREDVILQETEEFQVGDKSLIMLLQV